MMYKDIFEIFKFIYEIQNGKTPHDVFKILLTKSYFTLLYDLKDKYKVEYQSVDKNFIKNILQTPEYAYSKGESIDIINIREHAYFQEIQKKVKDKYGDISEEVFSDMEDFIQRAVSSELYYKRDTQNYKDFQDYIKSDLFKEDEKNIKLNPSSSSKIPKSPPQGLHPN